MNDTQVAEMTATVADLVAQRLESRFTVIPTLTLDQVAQTLGVSNEKVRQLCDRGEIPFIRMDRLYRIKPADVNAYLERHYNNKRRTVNV